MALTLFIILNIVVTLIEVQCAPSDVTSAEIDNSHTNDELDNTILIAESNETLDRCNETSIIDNITAPENAEAIKEEHLSKAIEESITEMLKEEIRKEEEATRVEDSVEAVDADEEDDADDVAEVRATTLDDVENSMPVDVRVEEALRNERDLRQALANEQELMELADSTAANDENCNRMNNTDCYKCDPNDKKLQCLNETTVALCTQNGMQRLIRCTGLTPVCHPTLNVCSSRRLVDRDISNAANAANAALKCPSYDAYYPDPGTCRKFYYCSNGKPYQYACAGNEVYNPMTRACAIQTATTPCRRFLCEGNNGRFAPYPGDPSVYTLCSNNRALELFHCPQGQAMHGRNQKCQTHCTGEGLISDYRSCSHFYECIASPTPGNNGYKVNRRSCPPKMVFHPVSLYCVPQHQYPTCSTKPPTILTQPPITTLRTFHTPTSSGQSFTTSYSTITPGNTIYTSPLPADITTMPYQY